MKFRNLFFRKEKSLQCTLKKILGARKFETLLALNNDWRDLPGEAAQQLQISVNDLLQKVSSQFNVPFISRVPYIDIEKLPDDVNITDLRRMACIPRIGANGITAFICLDPKRGRAVFPKKDIPMAIASWASIQAAINESEAVYKTKYKDIEEAKYLQAKEAAKQALHLVINQVKTFSVDKLEISFSNSERIVYNFITNENKKAEGDISNRVRNGLFRLLSDFNIEPSSTLSISDIAKHSLNVNFDEERSLFTICLQSNVIPFPEQAPQRGMELSPLRNGQPGKVLIVDDNQVFAKVLEKFLAKLNVTATFAQNGKDALLKLRDEESRPDLTICDLHMPEMNGCEFLKRVRGELNLPEMPVIILTSDNDIETQLQLLTDGADAFIAKNEDPRLLCVKIQKLLEKVQRRRAA